jgi:type IV pilus assembly protein PilX
MTRIRPSNGYPGLRGRRDQGGMVLIVVLVVLMVTFLAGTGVIRAAFNGNVIAGNFSFQQAAVQASDRAITDALTVVANRVAGGSANTAVDHQYFPVRQSPVDARGVPTAITWASVPCVNEKGALVADCAAETGNYRVQYVIERMCSANPDLTDVTDIRGKCEYEASDTAMAPSSIGVRYRVLIRVRGPRGTDSWFESVVSGPAST